MSRTDGGAARIEPFTVHVDDEVLDDLARRLRRTRWPDALPGSGWSLGTDLAYLQDLCRWWAGEFDWRAVEADLNRRRHVLARVDGQPHHAMVVKSPHDDALPLVLMHGWPSSFLEFWWVVDRLADPPTGRAADAFHVVCPSLPGFGFSGPTRRPGWTPHRMAGGVDELMTRLGFEQYGAQGGDWGAIVASELGVVAPERVVGVHVNTVVARRPGDDPPLSAADASDLAAMQDRGRDESGYRQIQATRPQSLSAGLGDSPAGLAAWLVEKYRAWSDCGGDVESCVPRWWLCATFTLYWATGTIASANRLYAEVRRVGRQPPQRVPVPVGCLRLPADGIRFPRSWVEATYDVVRWSEGDAGGHFAAIEQPGLLVDDVTAFFAPLR